MDRRDFAGVLFAAVPILATLLLDRLAVAPVDALVQSGWAPFVAGLLSFLVWILYVFGVRRWLGPTRADLQEALDKMITFHYKEDADGNPRPGLSGEGIIREHAPPDVRAKWWEDLGLGEPPKRRGRY